MIYKESRFKRFDLFLKVSRYSSETNTRLSMPKKIPNDDPKGIEFYIEWFSTALELTDLVCLENRIHKEYLSLAWRMVAEILLCNVVQ